MFWFARGIFLVVWRAALHLSARSYISQQIPFFQRSGSAVPAGRSASAGQQRSKKKWKAGYKSWRKAIITKDLENVLPAWVPYAQVDIRLLYGGTGIRGRECIRRKDPKSGRLDSCSLRRTFGGISDRAKCHCRYACSCCRRPGTTGHPGSEHLKVFFMDLGNVEECELLVGQIDCNEFVNP